MSLNKWFPLKVKKVKTFPLVGDFTTGQQHLEIGISTCSLYDYW